MVLMARQYKECMRNKYCHGIGHAQNMPRTVNAFFLQTNLSNQKLINKQLKPLTGIFGLVLILSTIIGLFQLPDQRKTSNKPEISWVATTENLSDKKPLSPKSNFL